MKKTEFLLEFVLFHAMQFLTKFEQMYQCFTIFLDSRTLGWKIEMNLKLKSCDGYTVLISREYKYVIEYITNPYNFHLSSVSSSKYNKTSIVIQGMPWTQHLWGKNNI